MNTISLTRSIKTVLSTVTKRARDKTGPVKMVLSMEMARTTSPRVVPQAVPITAAAELARSVVVTPTAVARRRCVRAGRVRAKATVRVVVVISNAVTTASIQPVNPVHRMAAHVVRMLSAAADSVTPLGTVRHLSTAVGVKGVVFVILRLASVSAQILFSVRLMETAVEVLDQHGAYEKNIQKIFRTFLDITGRCLRHWL